MKIQATQDNLSKGIGIVSRVVAQRSTLPILGNILLATDDKRLKLSATNLEIGITCWIGAKIEEDGAITLPARTFGDLVNALPSGELVDLSLTEKTQTATVQCGRSKNNIKGISADEYPLIPHPVGAVGDSVHIDPAILKKLIDQVVFAAATDESRPILTGVLVKIAGNSITLAAADGFRLSTKSALLEDYSSADVDVIVPAKALIELARIMGDEKSPISITSTPSGAQIVFGLTNIELVTQLVDGKFPPYEAIIPKSSATKVTVGTKELKSACKAANVFARESANIVRLKVEGVDMENAMVGTVTVGATSAETGDNVGVLEAVRLEGPDVEIAFNSVYLKDALDALDGEQVTLELNDGTKPGLIREGDLTIVVMPMHIGGR